MTEIEFLRSRIDQMASLVVELAKESKKNAETLLVLHERNEGKIQALQEQVKVLQERLANNTRSVHNLEMSHAVFGGSFNAEK